MDDQRSETCVLWDKVKKDFFNCKDSRVLAGYGTNTFGIELKPRCLVGIGGRDGKWAAGSEDRSIEFRLEVGQRGQLQNHGNFLEFRFDRESTTYKVEISVSRRFPSSIKYAITPSSDGGPYKRQWNLSGITPQEFSFRAENFIRNYSLTEAK